MTTPLTPPDPAGGPPTPDDLVPPWPPTPDTEVPSGSGLAAPPADAPAGFGAPDAGDGVDVTTPISVPAGDGTVDPAPTDHRTRNRVIGGVVALLVVAALATCAVIIAGLRSDLDAAEADRDALQNQLDASEQRVAALERDVEEADASIAALEAERDAALADADAARAEAEAAQADVDSVQGDAESLQAQFDEQSEALAAAEAELAAAEAQIETLTAELEAAADARTASLNDGQLSREEYALVQGALLQEGFTITIPYETAVLYVEPICAVQSIDEAVAVAATIAQETGQDVTATEAMVGGIGTVACSDLYAGLAL